MADNGSGDDDERKKKRHEKCATQYGGGANVFLSLSVGGPPSENRHLTPLDLDGDGRRVWEKVAEVGGIFFFLLG